jgi:hypothetical protein
MLEYMTRREELALARHYPIAYQGAREMVTALGVPNRRQTVYLSSQAVHHGKQVWLRAQDHVPLIAMLYDTDGKLWAVDQRFTEYCVTLGEVPLIIREVSGFTPKHYTIPTEHPRARVCSGGRQCQCWRL